MIILLENFVEWNPSQRICHAMVHTGSLTPAMRPVQRYMAGSGIDRSRDSKLDSLHMQSNVFLSDLFVFNTIRDHKRYELYMPIEWLNEIFIMSWIPTR